MLVAHSRFILVIHILPIITRENSFGKHRETKNRRRRLVSCRALQFIASKFFAIFTWILIFQQDEASSQQDN